MATHQSTCLPSAFRQSGPWPAFQTCLKCVPTQGQRVLNPQQKAFQQLLTLEQRACCDLNALCNVDMARKMDTVHV